MIDTPQRISNELRCKCIREDEIVDPDALPGCTRECPTCGTPYILDGITWRNAFTISKAKRDKLTQLGNIHQLTR